jgi:hypothetical protein
MEFATVAAAKADPRVKSAFANKAGKIQVVWFPGKKPEPEPEPANTAKKQEPETKETAVVKKQEADSVSWGVVVGVTLALAAAAGVAVYLYNSRK